MESISTQLWPIHRCISAAKTSIYHQGQPPYGIFSIRRGFVKLVSLNKNGQHRIIRLLGPGSCIGLEALLNENYHQTAEAVTELDFCTIPIKTIYHIEKEQPILYEQLQKQWDQQLYEADKWLSELLVGSIKGRVCRFLLMQYHLQKLPDNKIILISNQDIASILATSKETISRCITNLRNEGIIQRQEKRLYTLDLESIQAIADE